MFTTEVMYVRPSIEVVVSFNVIVWSGRVCKNRPKEDMHSWSAVHSTKPEAFYQHGLTSITAWIINHIRIKVRDEITYSYGIMRPFILIMGMPMLARHPYTETTPDHIWSSQSTSISCPHAQAMGCMLPVFPRKLHCHNGTRLSFLCTSVIQHKFHSESPGTSHLLVQVYG